MKILVLILSLLAPLRMFAASGTIIHNFQNKPILSDGDWLVSEDYGGSTNSKTAYIDLKTDVQATSRQVWSSNINSTIGPLIVTASPLSDSNAVAIFGVNQTNFNLINKSQPGIGLIFEGNYDAPFTTSRVVEAYIQAIAATNAVESTNYQRPWMTTFDASRGNMLTTYYGAGNGQGHSFRINHHNGTAGSVENTIGDLRLDLTEDRFDLMNYIAGPSPATYPGSLSFWSGETDNAINGVEWFSDSSSSGYGFRIPSVLDTSAGVTDFLLKFQGRNNSLNWSDLAYLSQKFGLYVKSNLTVSGFMGGNTRFIATNSIANVTGEVGGSFTQGNGFRWGSLVPIGNATNNLIGSFGIVRKDSTVGSWAGVWEVNLMNVFGQWLTNAFTISGGQSGEQIARVGIGTRTPPASSIFDVESSLAGSLPMPRMTQAQRQAILSPASGLWVYQTDSPIGPYYYDGSSWQLVANGSTAVTSARAVNTSGSITGGGNLSADRTLSLVNDNATPGNLYLYGTDSSGTKGWFSTTTQCTGAGLVRNTRAVNSAGSIVGGGDLSADRTLQLANDNATPGNNQYYGTDASGTKGFFAIPGTTGSALTAETEDGTTVVTNVNTIKVTNGTLSDNGSGVVSIVTGGTVSPEVEIQGWTTHTPDATPVSNSFHLSGRSYVFEINVVADYNTGVAYSSFGYTVKGLLGNNGVGFAGTLNPGTPTTFVNSLSVGGVSLSSTPGTQGAITVTLTGAAGKDIAWRVTIQATEL